MFQFFTFSLFLMPDNFNHTRASCSVLMQIAVNLESESLKQAQGVHEGVWGG